MSALNYRNARTYSDLLRLRPTNSSGTCCACHAFGVETWPLSVRANICRPCAERKGDAVLGSVVRRERKAVAWIKRLPDSSDALISVVCKVRAERVAELRAAARTEAP